MLTHLHPEPSNPARVVILGAGGFVSGEAEKRLEAIGVPILALSRKVLDLTAPGAGVALAQQLRADDAVLFVAAKAPVKSGEMLVDNLRMGNAVCEAVSRCPVGHLVYVSSDAVYADSEQPLNEQSCAQPGSLHGVMHLAREVMLAAAFKGPLCILRPTLIFGDADPHNGYGPNRFRRLASKGEDIELFGAGEEKRDHVWVGDVAAMIKLVLCRRSAGVLNVATGTVTSFADIAEAAARSGGHRSQIKSLPRSGPMPHNGHRPFDVRNVHESFGPYRFKSLSEWVAEQEPGGHVA